jgi:hypothetical protein
VFLERVNILGPSSFCFALVVVLDAWGTEGNITWKDGLRTIDQEEGRIACSLDFLGTKALDDLR